jgi:hypothetical protein
VVEEHQDLQHWQCKGCSLLFTDKARTRHTTAFHHNHHSFTKILIIPAHRFWRGLGNFLAKITNEFKGSSLNFDFWAILALGVKALNVNSSQDWQLPFDPGLLEIPCHLKLKGSP